MIHDDRLSQQTRFHFFEDLKFKNFKAEIDVGKVIRGSGNSSSEKALILMSCEGWDEAVMNMSLSEKSILTISRYMHL
jgi:hypothetical protein